VTKVLYVEHNDDNLYMLKTRLSYGTVDAGLLRVGPRTPSRMSLSDCCASAVTGHAAAAPPSSVRNWRRLRSSMGSSPEPAVPAYRRRRMPPLVLGVDLNCSESRIAETDIVVQICAGRLG
jgi:hypothetical protein